MSRCQYWLPLAVWVKSDAGTRARSRPDQGPAVIRTDAVGGIDVEDSAAGRNIRPLSTYPPPSPKYEDVPLKAQGSRSTL